GRRHHPRHVRALGVRAHEPVRAHRVAGEPGRRARPRALGRARRALRRRRRRRRLRDLPARGRRGRADELVVGDARLPRRPAHPAGGRHARQRRGRPARGEGAAAGHDAEAGLEPRRAQPHRLPRRLDDGAHERRLRQRLQGAVGALPQARRLGRAVPVDVAGGRARRAAGRARPHLVAPEALGGRRGAAAVSRELVLPRRDGRLERYAPRLEGPEWPRPAAPFRSRVAYAAAHVVKDPLGPDSGPEAIDWDATVAYRRHLWSYGLGVAEAMDTAQRGMGLDWEATKVLVQRACLAAREAGGAIVCGASTDQGPAGETLALDDIVELYLEQVEHIEASGGRVVVMCSRHLARAARGPDDYAYVYDRVLSRVKEPAVVHWLGEMFDPSLAGYWGSRDVAAAMDACLAVLTAHADKVEGIKLSLLDAAHEVTMRARLPGGVRMFTGDDFNYPDLILGDGTHHSDALLGIFDAIAP